MQTTMKTALDPLRIEQGKHRFTLWRFLPLFMVQVLTGFNDNVLRAVLLILITFSSTRILGIQNGVLINLAVLLFTLPIFLFSSYSGKISDCYNKVKIIRWIKACEVVIIGIAAFSLYYQCYVLLLLTFFAMGTHLTFMGPVKFSIIPEFYVAEDISLATAYIEVSAFFAILIGQTFGSWAMASNWVVLIVITMVASSLVGLWYSFKLTPIITPSVKLHFDLNPFRDSWRMFKAVTTYPLGILVHIHALAWFWALGLINTTELSLFTLSYLGGSGHLFSVFLALISIGIGLGSIVCAKMSKGKVIHNYIIYATLLISLMMWFILFTHPQLKPHHDSLKVFIHSSLGMMVLVAVFLKSFFAGFYSLTCYTELQLLSSSEIRSQVIASSNIMSGIYLVFTSIACSLLQIIMTSWGVLFIASILNVICAGFYWLMIRPKK